MAGETPNHGYGLYIAGCDSAALVVGEISRPKHWGHSLLSLGQVTRGNSPPRLEPQDHGSILPLEYL